MGRLSKRWHSMSEVQEGLDRPKSMPGLRVVFFGDSITHGVGDQEALGWPGRLARLERRRGNAFTTYNLGVRSDTSRNISARWRAECDARLPGPAPRLLVFSFGLNDATRVDGKLRVGLQESIAVSEAMLAEAIRIGPVLWVGPTPVDDTRQPLLSSLGVLQTKSNAETARYNAAFETLATKLGAPYLNLFGLLGENQNWSRSLVDGVHPTAGGYDIIAAQVANWHAWLRAVAGKDVSKGVAAKVGAES